MSSRYRKKSPREKDVTSRFLSDNLDEDRLDAQQRFTPRSKSAQQNKMERTALLRAGQSDLAQDLQSLPVGQVIQVHSLYSQVRAEGGIRLCVIRKTLNKLSETAIVVGDRVRFRDTGAHDELGRPEAVIEQVLPRDTILTRADSFHGHHQHPIVANAQQMLIVASLARPRVKWGLIDRMIVAAQAGGLVPLLCLNKMDLAEDDEAGMPEPALAILGHYASLGITTFQTCAVSGIGIDAVAAAIKDRITVLAGHSGVGKSTVIAALEPGLDVRIGQVSEVTEKGRHTTTSARLYPLAMGGDVIDTPGVKLFGLWGVTRENLQEFFPDVRNQTAPPWRVESYQRIAESLQ